MNQDKVSAEAVKSLLKINSKVSVFDCLESTNTTAKIAAQNGGTNGDIIIALSQTGGKGRMGRNFYSPENNGIYFSIILRPKIKTEDVSLITPIAAVAMARAIEEITKKSPKIKWVNDIFLNNKKVCGILSEAAFSQNGVAEYIILGIGINITTPKNGYPEDIKDIAGSIYEENETPKVNELIAAVVNIFFDFYKDLNSPTLPKEYQKRMMLIDSNINYTENCIQKSGVIVGIDNKFRLIIKNEKGDHAHLGSGEVTVGSKHVQDAEC